MDDRQMIKFEIYFFFLSFVLNTYFAHREEYNQNIILELGSNILNRMQYLL